MLSRNSRVNVLVEVKFPYTLTRKRLVKLVNVVVGTNNVYVFISCAPIVTPAAAFPATIRVGFDTPSASTEYKSQ